MHRTRKRNPAAVISLLLLLGVVASHTQAREVPGFGVIVNDDADLSFTSPVPEEAVRHLEQSVDALAGTPVKTLVYSVGSGSDVMVYPTKVASVWGWRQTRYEEEDELWRIRVRNARACLQAGVDPIRVTGERAKKLGLFFFPSLRMNDAHFVFDPFNYPLTGRFWIEHHERYTIGASPIKGRKGYENALDFSHRAVRRHRLNVIAEVLARYSDIIDGIELDFNRFQLFFPEGKAGERGHLITEMVAEVRRGLDRLAQKNGRPYYLIVRVPPTLANCRWAGLEVEKWMGGRFVDVVSPAQLMTLAYEMPVDEFVALARKNGVRVYPSLYPRTGWRVPFNPAAATVADYAAGLGREATLEELRGAASNYWRLGADGFYLFNFHKQGNARRPYPDGMYRLLRDLSVPVAIGGESKVYGVTKAYYLDHEDSYEYRKQIPRRLSGDLPHRLRLLVGDDLNAPIYRLETCALRLGLRGASGGTSIQVRVNGASVYSKAVGADLIQAGSNRRALEKNREAAESYLFIPIRDPKVLRPGFNELSLRVVHPGGDAQLVLTDVELGVSFYNQFWDILRRRETRQTQ